MTAISYYLFLVHICILSANFFLNYYLLYCTLQFNCYESSLEIDVIFQNIIARIWTEKRQEDTQSKNEMIKETLFLEEYWMRPYHVSATC